MLKVIFALFLSYALAISASSDQNQSKKQELTWNTSKTVVISKKEAKYQQYKKNLDIENKKLEDDGFCSCNNN